MEDGWSPVTHPRSRRSTTTPRATLGTPFPEYGYSSTGGIRSRTHAMSPRLRNCSNAWPSECALLLFLTLPLTRLRSVSSVKTLEEAKTTKGCLYMQMPVQEVRTASVWNIRRDSCTAPSAPCSTGPCSLVSSRRSRRRATTPRWTSSRSLTRRDFCPRRTSETRTNLPQAERVGGARAVIPSERYTIIHPLLGLFP